jgi:tetratricopeptide (TPR) repeat protein
MAMKSFEDRTGRRPDLWDFVETASNADILKLDTLTGQAHWIGPTSELQMVSFGRPMVETFEGRELEFKELSDFVRSPDSSCCLVVGLPGIGKSTLVSRLFEETKNIRSVLWYTVHEWDSVQSVARVLIDFFPPTVRERFPDLGREWELADLFSPLVMSLRETKPVLFLDDVDRAATNVSVLLHLVCDAVDSSGPSKIVLISRVVPNFLISGGVNMKQVELKCIDQNASVLLASKWKAADPDKVAEESGGHPLMLRLACEIGAIAARGSIDEMLGEHFQRVLNGQEKRMLEFLSVIRLPIPARELPGARPETISSLKRKGLVQEFAEGIAVHKLVRAYFNQQISADESIRLHITAAEVCHGRTGERWRLEEISQSLLATNWEKAIQVLLENSEGLISDFPEEAISLVTNIPMDSLQPVARARLSYLKGRLHSVLGKTHEALEDFELALSFLDKDNDEALRATVQGFYARILSEENKISESLETHQRALLYYEGSKDQAGQIREWMGIGSTWRRGRGLEAAMLAFQKALAIGMANDDKAAIAACLNNMALTKWEMGELKDAEKDLKQSISNAKMAGDAVGEGIGQTNLADLYTVQLKEKESENLRLESAETFRRAGDLVQYKMIKARWAEEVTASGRGGEAVSALEGMIGVSGRSIRSGRGRKTEYIDEGDITLLIALIRVNRISRNRGKAMSADDVLRHLAKDLESRDLEAQAEMEAALVQEAFGDLDPALGHLKKAEEILRELGNSDGLGAVYLQAGMIRLEKGQKNEALIDLREAARHSERTGNPIAYAAVLDELGEALGSVSPEGREYLEKARELRNSARLKAQDLS